MITEGCYCCEVRSEPFGTDPHPSTAQPPAYVWTTRSGDNVPLCIDCCAEWREYYYSTRPHILDRISITQFRVIR